MVGLNPDMVNQAAMRQAQQEAAVHQKKMLHLNITAAIYQPIAERHVWDVVTAPHKSEPSPSGDDIGGAAVDLEYLRRVRGAAADAASVLMEGFGLVKIGEKTKEGGDA